LEKLAASAIEPEVCILDIMMPQMNGFETIGRLRNKYPLLKILILSGFMREPYIINMIRAGANGYLSKSCHPDEIIKAIQQVKTSDFYCGENFTARYVTTVRNSEPKIASPTEREIQLLKWCVEDMTYGEIARKMNTTEKSIEGYRNKLFQKLGVKTRVGLAIYAVKYGYVTLESGPVPN
jgi:DNA-binding NarL/FixJ family response regulator